MTSSQNTLAETSSTQTVAPPACTQLYFQQRAAALANEHVTTREIKKRIREENRRCPFPLPAKALDFVFATIKAPKSGAHTHPNSTRPTAPSATDHKPPMVPIPIQPTAEREQKWQGIKAFLNENYLNPDIDAAKVIFASVASHRIADYPPAWGLGIAPAGSMKTEILKSLDGLPSVHLIDEVTANTFISGKLSDPGAPRTTPASLLHRIGNDGP